MKLEIIREDDVVNWENQNPGSTEEQYYIAVKKQAAAEHQKRIFRKKLDQYENLVVKNYNWNKDFIVPVSNTIKIDYLVWGLPTSTPNYQQAWNAVKFFGDRYNHAKSLVGKYQRLAAKLKKTVRTELFNDLKYKTQPGQLPSASVPRKIYYTKDNYFSNPYWNREDTISRYAGPPGHFDKFSVVERNLLVDLERILKRNGIPGLTVMYGRTIKQGKWTTNHFVVIGANNRLIWKHMNGNVLFIDGKRVSSGIITGIDQSLKLQQQKKFLEPLKNGAL